MRVSERGKKVLQQRRDQLHLPWFGSRSSHLTHMPVQTALYATEGHHSGGSHQRWMVGFARAGCSVAPPPLHCVSLLLRAFDACYRNHRSHCNNKTITGHLKCRTVRPDRAPRSAARGRPAPLSASAPPTTPRLRRAVLLAAARIRLPTSLNGCGLRSAVTTSSAVYLASFRAVAPAIVAASSPAAQPSRT